MSATYAVTGVASGIGAALARVLTAVGHVVIGFDVQPTSENVDRFVLLDLDDPEAIDDAASRVSTKLDGLCNNAGLPPRPGLETAILQVNFLGQRRFTEALLPHLAPGASIVNIASRAGSGWRDNVEQIARLAAITERSDLPGFVASEQLDATRCYNLSKEATILWTIAMTERLIRSDMRVNSVSPGAIATGILDDFAKAFGERMGRNVERAGRPGKPEEVAEVAAFLLSPASAWLKGIDVPVDGGMGAFNLADALDLVTFGSVARRGL